MPIFILRWPSFYLFFFCVTGSEMKIAKSENRPGNRYPATPTDMEIDTRLEEQ